MKRNHLRGFTLLEVMIAVTLTLVLTGFIVANYNSYNDTQQIRQAALTLKNNFRYAQSRASAGEKPNEGTCTELAGWRISFTATSYTMQPECVDGIATGVSDTTTFSLPAAITFSPVPAPITFMVLARGTGASGGVTIYLTGKSQTYAIQVAPSGDIIDVGFQ